MDDLLAEFVGECREMLEALGGEIVAWEATPGDRERLDAIFRFVHTVKGNCGFFDFPRLAELSHAAEDALADVRAGRRPADAQLVSAVLAVIDRIGDFIEAIAAGENEPGESDDALIAALGEDADSAAPLVATPTLAVQQNGDRSVRAPAHQRSVRLPVELLDQVMSGVSDIVLARNELARRLREAEDVDASIESAFERLSGMIGNVRDSMTRTRMQPVDTLFATMPRLVRDIATQLGKQVMVDIDGGDVELDREMVEFIRDPLTHIIRNAVDHGIELPAERLAQGKREIGLLSISARQSGNQILIDIVDDGSGIDAAKLVRRAVAAGIVTPAEAEALPLREKLMLICEPGLSTAEEVTSISGRGVGMDVVRANVERIGGSIAIDTAPGVGTRITLRVPLTLTITPVLTIGLAGQRFALPRSYIEEILDASTGTLQFNRLGEADFVRMRNAWIPCLSLGTILGLDHCEGKFAQTIVVIRLTGGDLYGLAADRLFDHEELVIKPVAPAIMATGLYAGSTLTDDGSPILLLDVAGIARDGGLSFDMHDRGRQQELLVPAAEEQPSVPVLVFTALDGRRCGIRMAIVDRIDEVAEGALELAPERGFVVMEGEILPLAGAGDCILDTQRLKVLRLSDGEAHVAYACLEDADIKAVTEPVSPTPNSPDCEGVTLIEGEPVELIDAHWLFAHHARRQAPSADKLCRLPDNDPWIRDFLRPLIEAAGYRIAGPGDAEVAAELAIGPEGWEAADHSADRRIVLRARPAPASAEDASIYRYDRAALLAAIQSAA